MCLIGVTMMEQTTPTAAQTQEDMIEGSGDEPQSASTSAPLATRVRFLMLTICCLTIRYFLWNRNSFVTHSFIRRSI